jgi:hypothetical protein
MKYAVEMVSDAMIHIPNFIKIGSDIQKLIGGIHRQHGDRISLLSFVQSKENRLKTETDLPEDYHFLGCDAV